MDGLEEQLQKIMNDPDSMAQILSLAQSFGLQPPEQASAAPPSAPSAAPTSPPPSLMPDEGFAKAIFGMMQQAQQSDGKQEALLRALKPFLRPERRGSIDRALQIAKISHLAGFALRNYGELPEKGGR